MSSSLFPDDVCTIDDKLSYLTALVMVTSEDGLARHLENGRGYVRVYRCANGDFVFAGNRCTPSVARAAIRNFIEDGPDFRFY